MSVVLVESSYRAKVAELLTRQAACQREFGRLVANEVDPLLSQPVLPPAITPVFVARGDSKRNRRSSRADTPRAT